MDTLLVQHVTRWLFVAECALIEGSFMTASTPSCC
jgi:hypothetical protein